MSFLMQRLHSVTEQNMAKFGLGLYFRVAFLAFLLPLASGDCIDLDLGMENGTIPDSKITASSEHTPAKNGRLNFTSGSSWCAGTSDANPYLQIDLQTLHIICAVSTQGNSKADQWVKTYTLNLSIDGSTWTDYKEGGQVKYFEGNNDKNSEVKHVVYGVLTRFLRLLPKAHQGGVCMRTEVFGVKSKPVNLALGKPTVQSSTDTSASGDSGNAVDGNVNAGHCSQTKQDDPSWWRVDLGSPGLVPVSEIYIVNGFGGSSSVTNSDYKITLGSDSTVANNPVCEGRYSFIDFKASAVCFTNPLKTGRYVGIMTTKSQILQLCEVEVYSRDNLAYGKPTDQFKGTYKDGKSSKAVDGNSNTHFTYGRPEGSCTMTLRTSSVKAWWRVDLQQVEHVSEVYIVNRGSDCTCPGRFKNFEIRVGTESSGDSDSNPRCGDTYTEKFPVGEGKSFFCRPSLKGRYVIVRFVVKNQPLTLCEVEVYSERRACPMQSIGVSSEETFPNSSFSALSSSSGNEAYKGRLNGAGAWSPSTDSNANDYLQINLKYEFVICAVATQGKPTANGWTEEYKLNLSLSGINWDTYQENNIDKVFNGNSGKNDIVKHSLKEIVSARFIRFQPTKFNSHKALRVEVYGILISAVPSQAPSGFSVTASNSTSIKASWHLPPEYARHGIITGFKLFYKKKGSAGPPTVLTINSSATRTRDVSGLDKYTEYEFQVLAFTSVGDGPKSTVKVERTKEDVPSKAPQNFSVSANSSTSIIASWQLPPADSRNGIIKGFRLFYKRNDSVGAPTVLNIDSEGSVTRVVSNLQKYMVYDFQVLAFTSVGNGTKSSTIVERTKEDVPSQPPSNFSLTVETSTSILASWQLPPENARNGIIKGFKLFYKKRSSSASVTMMLLIEDGTTLTKNVTGLAKYTEYDFQVLAFTSVGDGLNSTMIFKRTKEDAPSKPPSSFTVTGSTSTSIQVSWQLPPEDSRNGIITGFKLFYKKKKQAGSLKTMLLIEDEKARTENITGLDKYTIYEFQVLAFTSAGDGPRSSLVNRTDEDAPSKPPSSFTVTGSTSTSIKVSWQLPPEDSRNGIITGFKLFYKKKKQAGSLKTMLLIEDEKAHTENITGLDKYTIYEFQVLAFTSAGDGPRSSLVNRTDEDVPSQAPENFALAAKSSTSITASWQLPPANFWNGIIRGFKLFYKKKGSPGPTTIIPINSDSTFNKDITNLTKYTEYEFQVLAFTSAGDGERSTKLFKSTMEDAPSAPASFAFINVDPSKSHGPRINLTWSRPAKANGVIRSYDVFYSHNGDTKKESFGKDVLDHLVDVLGGVSYHFYVRAVTIKPGPNVTNTTDIPEYKPSVGPAGVSISKANETTFNISWEPLTREKSYGKVVMYDVKQELLPTGKRRKRSPIDSVTLNTTTTFVVLYDLPLCSRYDVFVRAYTTKGPGPYSLPVELQTSQPEAPLNFKATSSGSTQVTLEWKEPKLTAKGGLNYTVKYSGRKSYNKSFEVEDTIKAGKSTTYKVENLVPGSEYKFEVYGTSVCGKSLPKSVEVKTKVLAPIAPVVLNFTENTVSESFAGIYLWPAEQKNGPISAYQVIVLRVTDGAEELPDDYDSKLKDNANKDNLNFYIAAEIENNPVNEKSWEFTVGDDREYGTYVNKGLERGEKYIVFQRAVTRDKDEILEGAAIKVAKLSVTPKDVGTTDESQGSGSSNVAAIVVPVVLLLLIIPAVVVALLFYWRRKQSETRTDSRTPVALDDMKNDSPDISASTSNLVYQNVAEIQRPAQDVKEASPPEQTEAIYSNAEDDKPKPIPVAEFAKYFKNKSSNGAIVLREEFKNLPGGMQFPWEIGKNNRVKNRYGNIVSYDHSRVVLEKIQNDPKSDYINASYIPTYDEVSMCYIATQGPTSTTISDFWRMIWQENCLSIVMLTNLVEQGKGKCDQYWPDTTTKYGSITVTLHKTEAFADYDIRTFILVKNSEKREVHQFHYVTWPDKGVPQHSTALLGFREKIHARHQATGGPLVVHCSAGVGRTGTYIGIDAMLESAKENKTVFIQNYVQVMRRNRPHMVQKDDQYVFLHQAVMETLVCGNTEIAPHDLRITMNQLSRVHKASKKTGFAREFKRLELVTDLKASTEEATVAFKPSNITKNKYPDVVPLDIARVFLKSCDPEGNYINASFVDDYRLRNAYILTQAPLDNTIGDFWRMISQYDIGTVVMLNSVKEGRESYPQYWPSGGSQVKYGDITLQNLSENTSNSITTRTIRVFNAEPPKKTSTVHHLQFTGWANRDSCPDPQEILDLLTAIQRAQQQTGNGVIVFQCSDGVGRSGCVSTIMSVIERVKTEQTVDVFQTIKLIRAKRPGAVDTLDRYEFCYKTILAYLDSFSTYANFAEC